MLGDRLQVESRVLPRWLHAPLRCWAIVLVILSTGAATHAAFEFKEPRWDSSTRLLELARKKLGPGRVVLGAKLDWSLLTPADAVVVLHPDARLQFSQVSAFLSAGGRLALIDDFGKGDQLLSRFHIHRTSPPTRPLESLLDNQHLQLARPAETAGKSGVALRHPMVDDVEYVVTNHPAALATSEQVELTPVLHLADEHGQRQLLAVIGVIGDAAACGLDDGRPRNPKARCGRLFAMSDPSVFIDLMMQFEGNRNLARGMLEYLLEDDAWGRRQGNLYIVANDFSQSGDFGGAGEFERQLDSALDSVAAWLNDTQREGLPDRFAWLLAVVACTCIALVLWKTSSKVYERPTPRYARLPPLVSQGGLLGRAAVLSAEGTHRNLVVLELKAAIEDYLRQRFGLSSLASSGQLLEALDQRGDLDQPAMASLRDAFRQMTQAETAMLGSENARFSRESVKELHAALRRIVERIESHSRSTT